MKKLDIDAALKKAAALTNRKATTLQGIPIHLEQALNVCAKADSLITEEIAPLLARRPKVEAHLQEFIDYQIWLVEQQLTRAAIEARRRLELIRSLDTERKRAEELEKCIPLNTGTLHWFHNWAWTIDPREDCSIAIIPMKPFEFQEELILWLEDIVFFQRTCGLLEKSRDMAATWTVVGWQVKHWRFRPYFESLTGSRKEELVDNVGDMKSIFERIRFVLRMIPLWMLPEGFDFKRDVNFCKIVNPATGSSMTGESSNPDFGRGGRPTVIFFDEFASFPREGREAWAAASQSSRSRIPISTPKGRSNQFSDIRHKPEYEIPIFTLHWKRHLWKNVMNDAWYRMESRTMSREMLAQEIGIDYDASQPGQIFPQYRELIHIINWEQFSDFFGDPAIQTEQDGLEIPIIPKHWYLGMAMDIGYTVQHKWCIVWMARPAEGDSLRDCVFIYRSIVVPVGATVRQVANMIRKVEAPQKEHERMTMRLISHEALGVANTLMKEHALPFDQWDTKEGYNYGIPQMKNYMECRENVRHPFKPDIPKLGSSRFYLITHHSTTRYNPAIDKYEVMPARNRCPEHAALGIDCDHEELRMEIPRYHYPSSEEGKAVAEMRPFKDKDDAIDPTRALFSQFCPQSAPLGDLKKRENKLAPYLQTKAIMGHEDQDYRNRLLVSREFALADMEERKKENSDDWRERLWEPK